MNRRAFLASLSGLLAEQSLRSLHIHAEEPFHFTDDPFKLGVASGDPYHDSVVLWTRLAPTIAQPDYGLPPHAVDVRWEVSTDAAMKNVLFSGTIAATPELNHSVRVEAVGLQPGREYFYRFHAGGATSPIGRTKTAPAPHSYVDRVRFAFASCQSYENGYYVCHRDMANQDLDVVLFLGDYIYERHNPKVQNIRLTDLLDVKTVDEYRHHYAQYHMDPDLALCHQMHPWIVTPDDHEVENNWAGDDGTRTHGAALIARRIAGYRAYFENMPLRSLCTPQGSHMQLYRNLSYGGLLQFSVLDTRQFRTKQPCKNPHAGCNDRNDPDATMMGAAQEKWLADTLRQSHAQWNVLANQTRIVQDMTTDATGKLAYDEDGWDGYTAARVRLAKTLTETGARNPFVISGDIHHTCVGEIKADYSRPNSPIVASEVTGTSITSGGDGTDAVEGTSTRLAANPHILYENHRRGYILCEANKKQLTSVLRSPDHVTVHDAPLFNRAAFHLESDRKGLQRDV